VEEIWAQLFLRHLLLLIWAKSAKMIGAKKKKRRSAKICSAKIFEFLHPKKCFYII